MPNSSECGCRRGVALLVRASLEGIEPPECPHHTGSGPVAHDAVEGPTGGRPLALNDDAGLTSAISHAFGAPVGTVTDL